MSSRSRLLDLAIAVNSADSLDSILEVVIENVGELIPHDRASVALADPRRGLLEIRRLGLRHETEAGKAESGRRLPLDESTVLGWATLRGETHVRRSAEEGFDFEAAQVTRQVVSHIIAPLRGREQVLGVLTIGSYRENAFGDDDVQAFETFARLTAVAIENLRNFDRVRHQAVRDGLTGAFNHRYLQEALKGEVERVKRYGGHCSLLMLDIDHFKRFNDRFGHQAGDRILCRTVDLLRERLRSTDMVFRYGGEEFAVILPSTSSDEALAVAEDLRATLAERDLFAATISEVQGVTVSVGVASAPRDADSREALIASADQALYQAKERGRDRVIVFSEIEAIRQLTEQLSGSVEEPERVAEQFLEEHAALRRHCQRVAGLADLVADRLELPLGRRVNLRIAAIFHDIGELGIPGELLAKPGRLDAAERRIVETHPLVGESLLRRAMRVRDVLEAVLYHHERFDGTGYPMGLAGEEIPYLARILAVAETFDALISERPYREPVPIDEAYGILRDGAGHQFDPALVEAFITAHSESAGDSDSPGDGDSPEPAPAG